MMRVEIKPELFRWARERAGLDIDALAHRFPQLMAWEQREVRPTLKQIERFAKATHAAIGFLFLQKPPVERVPIPDFRTFGDKQVKRPSPDLLDTLYICEERQEWYRNYARSTGEDKHPFVGSAKLTSDIETTAARIRHEIGFDLEERQQSPTWTEALRQFIEQAEELGILVMASGVVSNNNRRRLNPDEFRGFAMTDEFAPLVFINGADTKAGQMFTLAHEVAHIWLGESALSDAQPALIPEQRVERWCNQVAAELLVPLAVFKNEYRKNGDLHEEMNRLARRFKVSTLVILRRIYDAGGLKKEEFWNEYRDEVDRLMTLTRKSGGDFYLTQAARTSKRFTRALVANTLEGQTLHRDAFRMLGFSKLDTFKELGRTLGVIV
ncbi:MAG: ImmA/IrrE family metallo-endopeptidase [Elusimicrobia bacterium]|nr:ImmA/IrrE family metallo-endopeptidase [Candidatus Obscuribacterium magneticum]